MTIFKKSIFVIFLLSNSIMLPQLFAAENDRDVSRPILMKETEIKFHPAPGFPKGAELVLIRGDLSQAAPYTIRMKLPDGYVIPSHWHSIDEGVTMLSGTLNVGSGAKVDKSQSTALTAGGYLFVPAKWHHYLYTTGETIFQVDAIGPRTTKFDNQEEWAALIKKSKGN